jgi:hypothetical protein
MKNVCKSDNENIEMDGKIDNKKPIHIKLASVQVQLEMKTHFQQYFSYIVVVSFNGGGNRTAM